MTVNVGLIDRLFRTFLGVVLIAAPFLYASEIWENDFITYGAWVVGAVMLLTATVKFCPLYSLFGIRTCSVN